VMMGLAAFGVVKIGVGLARGRPVGFLTLLCLCAVGVALLFGEPGSRFRTPLRAVGRMVRPATPPVRFVINQGTPGEPRRYPCGAS
jgi:uncharacterized protein (TIGR04222 family)